MWNWSETGSESPATVLRRKRIACAWTLFWMLYSTLLNRICVDCIARGPFMYTVYIHMRVSCRLMLHWTVSTRLTYAIWQQKKVCRYVLINYSMCHSMCNMNHIHWWIPFIEQMSTFLTQLTSAPIGFTAFGLFTIDKPTIITVSPERHIT